MESTPSSEQDCRVEDTGRLVWMVLFHSLVLTGGLNRTTGVREAEQHLGILLSRGVPRNRIIVEDQSTNTAENVYLALPKMALAIELEGVRSVIAVVKWFHSRRAITTLKRYMPLELCQVRGAFQ